MMRNPTPAESKASIRAMKLEMMRKVIGSIRWLIDNPDAQTSRQLATDDRQSHLTPTDPAACKWCALGRVAHDFGVRPEMDADGNPNIASIYSYVQKAIMKPLGLHNYSFVTANDILSDPDRRQEKLKELMWTLGNKLDLMEKAA